MLGMDPGSCLDRSATTKIYPQYFLLFYLLVVSIIFIFLFGSVSVCLWCAWVCMHAMISTWLSEDIIWLSSFLPLWVLEFELRWSGFCGKCFYQLSHLASPCLCLFEIGSHVACSSGCPQTLCVAKDDLELLIFLPPPSASWDYWHVPPYLALCFYSETVLIRCQVGFELLILLLGL